MRALTLLFPVVFMTIVSCEQRGVDVEVTKNINTPSPYTLNHTDSLDLIIQSRDQNSLRDSLQKIRNFHSKNMSWRQFWRSLAQNIEYTGLNIDKKLEVLSLGREFCGPESDLAFLEHARTLYVETQKPELRKSLREKVLEYFRHCKIERQSKINQSFFNLFIDDYKTYQDLDLLQQHLKWLAVQGEMEFLRREWNDFLVPLSDDLIKSKRFDDLFELAQLGKELFPFRPQLARELLLGLANDTASLNRVMELMDIEEALLFVEYAAKELDNSEGIVQVVNQYLDKLAAFSIEQKASKGFLQILNRFFVSLSHFDQDLQSEDILKLLSKAASLVELSREQQEFLKGNYDRSFFLTLLAQRNAEKLALSHEALSDASAPVYGKTDALIQSYLKTLSGTMKERKQKREEYCQQVPNKEVDLNQFKRDVKSLLRYSGCLYVSETEGRLLSFNQDDLTSAAGQFIVAPGLDIEIEAQRVQGLMVDLSSEYKFAPLQRLETPEDYNALVIPLVFGVRVTKASDFFFENVRYYLPYHYVYQRAQSGPRDTRNLEKGKNGGELCLKIKREGLFSAHLISLGGEGQRAEQAPRGGQGDSSQLSEMALERWALSMQHSEILMPELRSPRDVLDLFQSAERDERGDIKIYLEPSYLNTMTSEQESRVMKKLERVRKDFQLEDADVQTILKKITTDAVDQLLAKISRLGPQIGTSLVEGLSEGVSLPPATEGEKARGAQKGDNGEINITRL